MAGGYTSAMKLDAQENHDFLTTREVAAYLRIKERRVYELVRRREIPCTRVTGKWLFPRALIDVWLAKGVTGEFAHWGPRPPVVAGSHDPLLEWAIKESGCGLALLPGGSLDGITRFARGEAVMAGLHLVDADSGDFNVPAVSRAFAGHDIVLIEWAWRTQGLIVAAGNPLGLRSLGDIKTLRARLALRQSEAGSHLLLARLLGEAGLRLEALRTAPLTAHGEMDLGLMILEGQADAGLAVEAVARQLKLDFLPLAQERYDLLLERRDYFEGPVQKLLAFAKTPALIGRARAMGGYDLMGLGGVTYNPT